MALEKSLPSSVGGWRQGEGFAARWENGTAALGDTIPITSISDDNFGNPGDTNNNGSITAPARGNWDRIVFAQGATGSISYVRLKFGSNSGSQGVIEMTNNSIPISNCLISDVGHGIALLGVSNPVITNVQINNCSSTPVYLSVSANPSITNMNFLANAITAIGLNGEDIAVNSRIAVRNLAGYTNITYYLMNGQLRMLSPAILSIMANHAPTPLILAPANGGFYNAGDIINFSGAGLDAEDGNVSANGFSWTIVFQHDTHTHPFLGPINGVTNGAFTIPTTGETSTNVWYRVNLTVTDSGGRQKSTFTDIVPRTAMLTLGSAPAGLQLTLDGQPVIAGTTVASVVGMVRSLGVVTPQIFGGFSYEFDSWSDGGLATHAIATPATDTAYLAAFNRPPGSGWALQFDGMRSHVSVPDSASVRLTGPMTVEAWIRRAATGLNIPSRKNTAAPATRRRSAAMRCASVTTTS